MNARQAVLKKLKSERKYYKKRPQDLTTIGFVNGLERAIEIIHRYAELGEWPDDSIARIALEVIETLAGGDFQPSQKTLEGIYKYAHIARGTCKNEHNEWRKELIKTHADMVKNGLIGGQNEKSLYIPR